MKYDVIHTDVGSQEALFETVSEILLKNQYVTGGYLEALKEREAVFPTGLKLESDKEDQVLSTAIPHTETDYCLVNKIIYVKNKQKITFRHMIDPSESCDVDAAFFILNNQKEGQVHVLSSIISFFTTKGNMETLRQLEDEETITQYLKEKGVFQ